MKRQMRRDMLRGVPNWIDCANWGLLIATLVLLCMLRLPIIGPLAIVAIVAIWALRAWRLDQPKPEPRFDYMASLIERTPTEATSVDIDAREMTARIFARHISWAEYWKLKGRGILASAVYEKYPELPRAEIIGG
jgi:hypothetical protein